MRFDEGHAYDSRLNEHNKEIGEFWSPEDHKQLALQEKEQEDVILRGTKEAVGAVVDGTAQGEKVREEEKNLTDTDDEPFLTSLEDDEPLIPPEPRSPPMTRSFPPEEDSDQASTPKPKARKPRGKAPIPPPSDKETRAMTGSSKPCFRYMNGVAPSHRHMHKALDALQSGDYLGLSKSQRTSDL